MDANTPSFLAEEHRPVTTIAAIMISVFLMGTGSALQGTALVVRGGMEGFSASVLGIVMALYYVGLAVGIFLASTFVRTVGYVRSFAAFASLASVSSLLHILIVDPFVWALLRLIHGVCISVMSVVVESWLNVTSSSVNRGRVLSLYSIVLMGAMGVGQPLLGVLNPATFHIFGLSSILISMCLVPLALAPVTGTPLVKKEKLNLTGPLKKSPLASAGVVVSGIVSGASWSLLPRYAQTGGLTNSSIGLLMFIMSLGTIVFQFPLGFLSDKRDRRLALLFSSAVATGVSLYIALVQPQSTGLFLAVLAFGGFGLPLYSLSIALMNDQLSKEELVKAASSVVLIYGIGSAFGPAISSVFMDLWGPSLLFITMAAFLGSFWLFSAFRLSTVPRKIRGTKGHYRVYPRTSMAAFKLLRRKPPTKT